MKKTVRTRMACLLLALATVFVSAPMLVLPLSAAETAAGTTEKSGFNTKYDSADCGYTLQKPAVEGGQLKDATVYPYFAVYRSNWSAGRVQSDNTLSLYSDYMSYSGGLGFLLDNKRSLWGEGGGIYQNGCLVVPKNTTSAIRYMAPHDGTLVFSVDRLKTHKDEQGHEFAICKNGTVVWPADGNWQAAEANTLYTPSVSIEVSAGDLIDFRVRRPEANISASAAGESARFSAVGESFSLSANYTEIGEKKNYTSFDIQKAWGTNFVPNLSILDTRPNGSEGENAMRGNNLTFPTAWSVGKVTNNGVFTLYDALDGVYNADFATGTTAEEGNTLWSDGGIYKNGTLIAPDGKKAVIRYTAPKDGELCYRVTDILKHKDSTAHSFTVQHNGVVVWPKDSSAVNLTESTAYATDPITLRVQAGDTIDLVVACSGGSESRAITQMKAAAYYTAYYDTVTRSAENAPGVVFDETDTSKSGVTVTWKGNWKYVIYENADQFARLNSGMVCDRRGTATKEFLGHPSRNGTMNFHVTGQVNSYWITLDGAVGAIAVLQNETAGKQYTISESGYYDLSFTKIFLDGKVTDAGTVWTAENVGFAIYQNGVKVWPTETEWYQPTAFNANEATVLADTMPTVFAAKGDVIEFVAHHLLDTNVRIRGIVLDGQVAKLSEDATASVSYASKAAGGALRSNTDEVKYFGGWQFISYGGDMTNEAKVAANRVVSQNTTDPSMTYYTSVACRAGLTGEAQGASSVLCHSHSNWGNTGAMALLKGDIVGYRYTAPKSGFIKLSVDHLGIYYAPIEGETETSANSAFAIYVGGKKVWPAGDAWQTFDTPGSYETDASLALPTREFYIREGETVEFLCKDIRPSDAKDASAWANRGNEISGTVTYTKFAEATAMGSARIDGNIGFTFGTVADDEHFKNTTVRNIRSDVGTVEGTTIRGIAPNEMTSPITYEVYADVTAPDGTTQTDVLVKTGTTSVAAYLRSLATDGGQTKETRDMVLALLHYGAAAQKHFATGEIAEEDLADYGMEEVSFTVGEATSDYAHTLPEGSTPAYYFSSATLLLLDELHMKVNLDLFEGQTAAKDLTKLTLQVADNEAFSGAASYTVSARADDEGYCYLKADFAVPTREFAKPFYVRLVDGEGNAVSSTLTYSVNTYIARMQGKGDQDEILRTIQILGVAAARYAQA